MLIPARFISQKYLTIYICITIKVLIFLYFCLSGKAHFGMGMGHGALGIGHWALGMGH